MHWKEVRPKSHHLTFPFLSGAGDIAGQQIEGTPLEGVLQSSQREVDFLPSLPPLFSDALFLFPGQFSLKVPLCSHSSWTFKGYTWRINAPGLGSRLLSDPHLWPSRGASPPTLNVHNSSKTKQPGQVGNLGTLF